MIKGKMIGKGMTAEVYEWGQDKVLKLFFDNVTMERVDYEASIGKTVHEAGVPSPAVFGVIDAEDRRGIIYERIEGKTMFLHIQKEPWMVYHYAQQLARLQYEVHKCKLKNLPAQKDKFTDRIKSSSQILGDRLGKILDYMESLPDGNSVCHGDFHFNNIMVSGNRLVPIDWTNAYCGNPLGDVARTCLIMRSPLKYPEFPDIMMPIIQYTKWLICWTYLNEYMRLSKAGYKDIYAWILPVAAARLRDKVPGEEKWLMSVIDKHLRE
ncbi:phosphotransferase family protein [Clostridium thermosuccinogenes]|jgi:uncharacterized protein (TIGR02172 family)|uniref:phosphotransferase family protein n=1 Tax=Clostridium thermosuccinogenes TaxID=84032 RepID=UPI000CCBD94D|nr:aminoglycoside phosphotransferase family protein [Pseudoclostridium thermosuccinogenes]PNT90383.1 aminoglycoside phosphotransferase [Pseudoclostridium thermosuccinogenes]